MAHCEKARHSQKCRSREDIAFYALHCPPPGSREKRVCAYLFSLRARRTAPSYQTCSALGPSPTSAHTTTRLLPVSSWTSLIRNHLQSSLIFMSVQKSAVRRISDRKTPGGWVHFRYCGCHLGLGRGGLLARFLSAGSPGSAGGSRPL
jgi:hypothetical protein